jgi:integrase
MSFSISRRYSEVYSSTPDHAYGAVRNVVRISKQYSCHDLRHTFAVRLYETKGHDIYRLSKALGHPNIGVTETYLKSIGGVA